MLDQPSRTHERRRDAEHPVAWSLTSSQLEDREEELLARLVSRAEARQWLEEGARFSLHRRRRDRRLAPSGGRGRTAMLPFPSLPRDLPARSRTDRARDHRAPWDPGAPRDDPRGNVRRRSERLSRSPSRRSARSAVATRPGCGSGWASRRCGSCRARSCWSSSRIALTRVDAAFAWRAYAACGSGLHRRFAAAGQSRRAVLSTGSTRSAQPSVSGAAVLLFVRRAFS